MKRNSLTNDSPKPIDKFGIDQTEDMTSKKSVAARNNWNIAKGLIDSDTEPEETESIAESDEECDDEEDDDEEGSENELVDDEAEEIEDYNSGDSIDEDERQEFKGKHFSFLFFFSTLHIFECVFHDLIFNIQKI